jgi:hypothetical protein
MVSAPPSAVACATGFRQTTRERLVVTLISHIRMKLARHILHLSSSHDSLINTRLDRILEVSSRDAEESAHIIVPGLHDLVDLRYRVCMLALTPSAQAAKLVGEFGGPTSGSFIRSVEEAPQN